MSELIPIREESALPAVARATNPSELLALAIEKGAPVESMERLVALVERMEDRKAERDYKEALAAFQEECPPIHKNAKAEIVSKSGGKWGYTYADLAEIERTVKPYMRKHGFSKTFGSSVNDNGVMKVTCYLHHCGGHTEESHFEAPIGKSGRLSDVQEGGAALNYGKRQSFLMALGINTGDPDPDGATHPKDDEPHEMSDECKDEIDRLWKECKKLPTFAESKFMALLKADYGTDNVDALPARAFNPIKAMLSKKLGGAK